MLSLCPHCKGKYNVTPQNIGQTFTCQFCRQPFTVTEAAPEGAQATQQPGTPGQQWPQQPGQAAQQWPPQPGQPGGFGQSGQQWPQQPGQAAQQWPQQPARPRPPKKHGVPVLFQITMAVLAAVLLVSFVLLLISVLSLRTSPAWLGPVDPVGAKTSAILGLVIGLCLPLHLLLFLYYVIRNQVESLKNQEEIKKLLAARENP
jgi:hypothetical protein